MTLVVTRGGGAEDCPAAEGFAERVRAITGNASVETNPAAPTETWVYLEITHDLGRYNALLQTRGRRQGSRALSDVSSNCASLSDAVAMTLALLLDANEQPVGARLQTARPAPSATPKPIPKPQEARYALLLGGGAGVGLLTGMTPWATGGLELLVGSRFRLGLGGAVALPERIHYLQGFTDLNLGWGYARGCALGFRSSAGVELTVCVSSMLGVLSGAGKLYDFTKTKRWAWLAVGLGPQLSGPLASPAFWWLSATGIAPLIRHGFAISIDGEEHDTFSMDAVAATASLGMGVRF